MAFTKDLVEPEPPMSGVLTESGSWLIESSTALSSLQPCKLKAKVGNIMCKSCLGCQSMRVSGKNDGYWSMRPWQEQE